MTNSLRTAALAAILAAVPLAASASTFLAEGAVHDEFADALDGGLADALAIETPAEGGALAGDLAGLVGTEIAGSSSAEGDTGDGDTGFAFASAGTTSVLRVENSGAAPIVVSYRLDWSVDASAGGVGWATASVQLATGTGDASGFVWDPLDLIFAAVAGADATSLFDSDGGGFEAMLRLAPLETVTLGLLVDAVGFADALDGGRGDFLAFADASVMVLDIATVPLPATLPMLLAALGGLGLARRRA